MFKKLKEKIQDTDAIKKKVQDLSASASASLRQGLAGQVKSADQLSNNGAAESDNMFSIDEEEPGDREGRSSRTGRSRHSSISSLASESSSLFFPATSSTPSRLLPAPPSMSDVESASEVDESVRGEETMTKSDLLQRLSRVQNLGRKYKVKFYELMEAYRVLESERERLRGTMEQSQDKALRRISELREQIQLDQKAKRDIEENYQLLLEEKDELNQVLKLQVGETKNMLEDMSEVQLLREGKDLPPELEEKIRAKNDRETETMRSLQQDNQKLRHTIKTREDLLKKCKDRINALTAERDGLKKTVDSLTQTAPHAQSSDDLRPRVNELQKRLKDTECVREALEIQVGSMKEQLVAFMTSSGSNHSSGATVVDDFSSSAVGDQEDNRGADELGSLFLESKIEMTRRQKVYEARLHCQSFSSMDDVIDGKQSFSMTSSKMLDSSGGANTTDHSGTLEHKFAEYKESLTNDETKKSLEEETARLRRELDILTAQTKVPPEHDQIVAELGDKLMTLTSTNEQLETALVRTTSQLDAIVQENDHKAARIATLETGETTARLSQELSNTREEYLLLKATLTQMTQDRGQDADRMTQLEGDLDSYRDSLRLVEQERARLSMELVTKATSNDDARRVVDVAASSGDEDALLAQLADTERHFNTVKSQVCQLEAEKLSLRGQLDELEASNQVMRQQLDENSDGSSVLTGHIAQLQSEKATLKSQLEDSAGLLESRIRDFEAEAQLSKETLAQLESQRCSLDTEKEAVARELQVSLEHSSLLEATIEQLGEQEGELRRELRELRDRCAQVENQGSDLHTEKASLRDQLDKSSQENSELSSRMTQLDAEKDSISQQLQSSLERCLLLESQISQLDSEKAAVTEKLEQSGENEAKLSHLEDENSTQLKRVSELEDEKNTQLKRVSELEDENSTQLKRVSELEDENSTQLKRVSELEDENSTQLKRVLELEDENSTQLKRVSELEDENSTQLKRVSELEDENSTQLKRVSELEDENSTQLKRVSELEDEVQQKESTLSLRLNENTQLTESLEKKISLGDEEKESSASQLKELTATQAQLEAEKASFQSQLEESWERCSKLEDDISRIEAERVTVNEQFQNSWGELVELRKTFSALETERTGYTVQVTEFEIRLAQVEEEKARFETELKRSQEELQKWQDRLAAENDSLLQRLKQSDETISVFGEERTVLTTQLESSSQDLVEVKSRLDESLLLCASLEQEKKELESEKQLLTDRVDNSSKGTEQLENECTQLNQKLRDSVELTTQLQTKLQDVENEKNSFQEQVSVMSEDKRQCSELELKNSCLSEQLESSANEITSLQGHMASLEDSKTALDVQSHGLQEELAAVTSQLAESKSSSSQMGEQICHLQSENSTLAEGNSQEVLDLQSRISEMKSERDAIQQELDQSQEKYRQLEGHFGELETSKAALNAELQKSLEHASIVETQLTAKDSELQSRCVDLDAQITFAKGTCSTFENRISELDLENSSLKASLEKTCEELSHLEKKSSGLEESLRVEKEKLAQILLCYENALHEMFPNSTPVAFLSDNAELVDAVVSSLAERATNWRAERENIKSEFQTKLDRTKSDFAACCRMMAQTVQMELTTLDKPTIKNLIKVFKEKETERVQLIEGKQEADCERLTLEEENTRLGADLEQAQSDLNVAEDRCSELEATVERLELEVRRGGEAVEEENTRLGADLEQAQSDLNVAEDRCSELEATVERLELEVRRGGEAVEEHGVLIDDREVQLETTKRERDELQTRVESLTVAKGERSRLEKRVKELEGKLETSAEQHQNELEVLREDFKNNLDSTMEEHSDKVKQVAKEFNAKMVDKEREFQFTFQEALEKARSEESRTRAHFQQELDTLTSSYEDQGEEYRAVEYRASQLDKQNQELTLSLKESEERLFSCQTNLTVALERVTALESELTTRIDEITSISERLQHLEDEKRDSEGRVEAVSASLLHKESLPPKSDLSAEHQEWIENIAGRIERAKQETMMARSGYDTNASTVDSRDYEVLQMHNSDLQEQLSQLNDEFKTLKDRLKATQESRSPSVGNQQTPPHSEGGNCFFGGQPNNSTTQAVSSRGGSLAHRLSSSSSMDHHTNSLTEATEYEYLKNILYKYMLGEETKYLSKVLCQVMKLTDDQTRRVMNHEDSKSISWLHPK